MENIALPELLRRYWNLDEEVPLALGVVGAESARRQESSLRRVLPDKVLRRVVTGFSRSSTVHPDTGQALYAVCRAARPACVFETGTYWGYSTAYLAAAVRDNGTGRVHSFDLYDKAGSHIPQSLRPFVELHRGRPSTESMPEVLRQATPSIFFQDSRHDYQGVAEELAVVAPCLEAGGAILFHDFVAPEVRQAALDGLPGYDIYELTGQDPQKLGIAIKSR